ncbi:electron transfer flavoprotein subunit alpha/FixB family protein (plasmid) [Fusobacteria bacterium ZRK30]|nr:electron transfer flavoprotein subunit alpha/FixB family protein [Fusobacteria bacterium ZRK30]
MNLNSYKGLLVYVEQRNEELLNVGLELLGIGRDLADQIGTEVTAVLLGPNNKEFHKELIGYGADKVIIAPDEKLIKFNTEYYAHALTSIIKDVKPEIVLVGATTIGRDFIPKVSARLGTGLTADCTKLEISDEKELHSTRPAFGGNLMATIVCKETRPQMSSVRPGVMVKKDFDPNRKGITEIYDVNFNGITSEVELLEEVIVKSDKIDITEANILVSAGRGATKHMEYVINFADVISGEVSGSRGAVDQGKVEQACQVGQTGKTVRPDLYIACGISGAIQHIAGMEDSDFIISINKDPDAPIHQVASLGIVGNVEKILPELIKQLRV